MVRIQRNGRPGFILMLLVAVSIALPCQPALAALVGTDAVADFPNAQVDRGRVLQLLAREEVRAALLAQGLDPIRCDRRFIAVVARQRAVDGRAAARCGADARS